MLLPEMSFYVLLALCFKGVFMLSLREVKQRSNLNKVHILLHENVSITLAIITLLIKSYSGVWFLT